MLKEAMQEFKTIVTEATKAVVVQIPGVDSVAYLVQNGSATSVPIPPARREHEASDLESFVAAAVELGGDTASIWHGHGETIAMFDDKDRRDCVTLSLIESNFFKAVQSLSAGRVFTQRELIQFLRVSLADCIGPDLLPIVRTLNFRKASAVQSSVQHTADSLGKSVEEAVTGASDLPEQFLATVPVYSNVLLYHRAGIDIAIDVDFEKQGFRLQVIGDGIPNAIREAQGVLQESIKEQLGDCKASVYYGKP